MKCVMVVDESLSAGLIANTTAALGLSLGSRVKGLAGPDLTDGSGVVHTGITAVAIPVLGADRRTVTELYQAGMRHRENLLLIGFSTTAQRIHSYESYQQAMAQIPTDTLQYLGICLYGPKQAVNHLCGQLRLLRQSV